MHGVLLAAPVLLAGCLTQGDWYTPAAGPPMSPESVSVLVLGPVDAPGVGAEVEIRPPMRDDALARWVPSLGKGVVNEGGEWYFPGPLPPAGSQVLVSRGDSEGAIVPVFEDAQAVGPVWRIVHLEPCVRLRFRVVDAEGRPVPGARVRVDLGGLPRRLPPVDFLADAAGCVESVPCPVRWIRPGASLWTGRGEGPKASASLDIETLRAGPIVLRLPE